MDKKSSSKNEGSFLFSTSLIFDENLDKLWLILKDLSTEIKVTDFLDNLKLIKGDNTWNVGNIFSLYWVGVSNIEAKCLSSIETRMKKKIKWQYICDIGISYYKEMVLYRLTKEDKTLVKINITRYQKNKLIDYHPQLDYYSKLHYEKLLSLSKHFKSIKKDKIAFQSCILDKNHIKIWNYTIDFRNISNLCPELIRNVEYKGPPDEVGTFIKCNLEDAKREQDNIIKEKEQIIKEKEEENQKINAEKNIIETEKLNVQNELEKLKEEYEIQKSQFEKLKEEAQNQKNELEKLNEDYQNQKTELNDLREKIKITQAEKEMEKIKEKERLDEEERIKKEEEEKLKKEKEDEENLKKEKEEEENLKKEKEEDERLRKEKEEEERLKQEKEEEERIKKEDEERLKKEKEEEERIKKEEEERLRKEKKEEEK